MITATLGDLLGRRVERDEDENESDRDALRVSGTLERRYDATRLRTDARKTGNFLRQVGVGPGRTVAIAAVPAPESVLALFGAALLGAPTRFVPVIASETKVSGTGATEAIDVRVLIGPVETMSDLPVNASKRIAYGGASDDPEVAYFERDVWSENPAFPPGGPGEEEIAIGTGNGNHTHHEVVQAAEQVVETWSLGPGTAVTVRAPLTDPRTIVAGVLAPLSCGGVIVFPDAEIGGDVAVVAGETEDAPESRTIDVGEISLGDR